MPCRAALRPRSSVHGPHINRSSCTSALLWCGPIASYSLALAVPSSQPAHRRDVIVYRLHRRALSALVRAVVPCVVRSRLLPRLSGPQHCHYYQLKSTLAITHVHVRRLAYRSHSNPNQAVHPGTRPPDKQISCISQRVGPVDSISVSVSIVLTTTPGFVAYFKTTSLAHFVNKVCCEK